MWSGLLKNVIVTQRQMGLMFTNISENMAVDEPMDELVYSGSFIAFKYQAIF